MNKKAQEQSAHWTLQWFIQNIVIWIVIILIISFGVYFLLKWIRGF